MISKKDSFGKLYKMKVWPSSLTGKNVLADDNRHYQAHTHVHAHKRAHKRAGTKLIVYVYIIDHHGYVTFSDRVVLP